MVKRIDRIHVPRSVDKEIGPISEDSSYFRHEEPPNEAELLKMFRRWCNNCDGTFDDVLKEWVTGRLEMSLPVNPGPIDPNERQKRKPTKAFRIVLEGVFNEVQADKAKTKKRR